MHDLDTLAPVRKMEVTLNLGPQSLTIAGPNRVAFLFPRQSQVWILKQADIPLLGPPDVPEPEYLPDGLIRVPIPAEEMVYSPSRHR